MKAAQISQYGDPSLVSITEIGQPKPESGQLLIEVAAASLNPFDTTVRSGAYKASIPLQLPATLGGDIAGTIIELGEDVSGFAIGDTVYGQANVVAGNSGSFAEFAVTKAVQVAQAPKNVNLHEAAALPLIGVSALQALSEHLKVRNGTKLLIQGGSGGIGAIALQIAKHWGAYVAVTVPTQDVAYAKSLGADEVIDFKTQKFQDLLHGYDAVFDTAGGEVFKDSLAVLRPGAVGVSMIARVEESVATELGVSAFTQGTKVTTEALRELAVLVDEGVVKVRIDSVFALDQIVAAFERRESGQVAGKVVIAIK